MTAVATRPRERGAHAERQPAEPPAERLFEPGGATLEDAILELWDDLVAGRDATCPLCAGTMSMIGCSSCGSELS